MNWSSQKWKENKLVLDVQIKIQHCQHAYIEQEPGIQGCTVECPDWNDVKLPHRGYQSLQQCKTTIQRQLESTKTLIYICNHSGVCNYLKVKVHTNGPSGIDVKRF